MHVVYTAYKRDEIIWDRMARPVMQVSLGTRCSEALPWSLDEVQILSLCFKVLFTLYTPLVKARKRR